MAKTTRSADQTMSNSTNSNLLANHSEPVINFTDHTAKALTPAQRN